MDLNKDAHAPYKSAWEVTPKGVDKWLAERLAEGYVLHSYNGSLGAFGERVYAVVVYDPKRASALITECNQP